MSSAGLSGADWARGVPGATRARGVPGATGMTLPSLPWMRSAKAEINELVILIQLMIIFWICISC